MSVLLSGEEVNLILYIVTFNNIYEKTPITCIEKAPGLSFDSPVLT